MKQVRTFKGNYRSITGFVSYRGEPLAYESTLERDFLIYHIFRQDVLDIIPQPISIPFVKNGISYNYTPDYFVRFKCGEAVRSLIVEVKYREDWQANWREWSNKWKAAIQYCKENGYRFTIYDESRIRHQAFYNVNSLSAYKNLAIERGEIKAILQEIECRRRITVEKLLELFYKGDCLRPKGKRILWSLMSQQMIGFDIWGNLQDEQLEVWHVDQ